MRMWQQCFSLILSVIISGSVSAGWQLTVSPLVKVSRGEDAVLSCFFTPTKPNYSGMITVKWISTASHSPAFFQCPVKNDTVDGENPCAVSDFKYSLQGDPRRGDASLLIRKVQLNDNSMYFCRVELDGWNNYKVAKTELYVEAEPQILKLAVVKMPCGSDSAPWRLQCEAESNPLPKIVWLAPSRLKLENQGQSNKTSPYHVTSCVPYQEDEDKVLTCRVENALNHAEMVYPASNPTIPMKISLIVCGVIVFVVLVTGIITYCLKRSSHRQQVSEGPVEGGEELQAFYSEVAVPDSTSQKGSYHQQVSEGPVEGEKELQAFYSEVVMPDSTSSEGGQQPQTVYSEATMPDSVTCALYSPMNSQP